MRTMVVISDEVHRHAKSLAALAIEHNCDWITADHDFARFPGLRWRHPFQ